LEKGYLYFFFVLKFWDVTVRQAVRRGSVRGEEIGATLVVRSGSVRGKGRGDRGEGE
jgi:hypothetical protein